MYTVVNHLLAAFLEWKKNLHKTVRIPPSAIQLKLDL